MRCGSCRWRWPCCLRASGAWAQDYPARQVQARRALSGGRRDRRRVARRRRAARGGIEEDRSSSRTAAARPATSAPSRSSTRPPDGCTLLVNATVIATFTTASPSSAYDPFKDLAPVGGVGVTPTLIVAAAVDPRQRHQGPGRVEQEQARWPQLQHRRLRPAAASRGRGDRAAHRRQIHPRRLSRRRHRDDRSDRRAARFRRVPRRHHQAADRGAASSRRWRSSRTSGRSSCPTSRPRPNRACPA